MSVINTGTMQWRIGGEPKIEGLEIYFLLQKVPVTAEIIRLKNRQAAYSLTNSTARILKMKGAGTLVDVLQLSYSFHQNCSKLGTAITEDFKN
jgi:hypothetical protein